jgi:HEAT repeat protein
LADVGKACGCLGFVGHSRLARPELPAVSNLLDINPNDDRRTVDELINFALTEPDEEARVAIRILHHRGTREVLDRAITLCRSECPQERTLGADILRELGLPDRTFPGESTAVLLEMLQTETNASVLRSVLAAISHNGREMAIPVVLRFTEHFDVQVRQTVVVALSGYEDQRAIDALIRLSGDPAPLVRDWATFGLGTLLAKDTPTIRNALADRLDDPDFDTRGEAFIGLAERGDRRVVPALVRELTSDCVGSLAVEAASVIRDPELYSALVDLREWWDVDSILLEEAIAACQPV